MPSLTVGPVPPSLASAAVNSPYSQTFTASGGNSTDTYAYTETGSLPVGLSLSPSGLLAGIPETAGAYTFTVTATDNSNPSLVGSQTYTLNTALGFDLAPLPIGTFGVPYDQAEYITPAGGSGSYAFSETGPLPSGMSLNSTTGQLSGTPSQAGSFNFTVTATDTSSGLDASQNFTLPINLAISPGSPLNTVPVGVPDNTLFTASGGSGNYAFSETGTLPPGLSLSSTGQLTGTPTQSGSYSFTVAAADNNNPGLTGSQEYTLHVGLQLFPGEMSPASVGQSYNQYLMATGGSGDYNFTIAGNNPSWLNFYLNGTQTQLQGTPPAGSAGAYNFTITATDANNPALTVSQAYTLIVNPLTVNGPASLPPATVGSPYPSQSFTASGGTGPYTYEIDSWRNNLGQNGSGAFDGLSMDSTTGNLTGTPTQPGQYTFTVGAFDSSNPQNYGTQTFTLVVFATPNPAPTSAGPLTLSPNSLSTGTAGNAYGQTITASGGNPGDTYSFSETGALPTGMSFPSTGQLTGTPTQPGSYSFTVVATDNNNSSLTGSQQYTLTINNNNPTLPTTFAEPPSSSSQNQTLPTATLVVASTSGFPSSGELLVQTTAGTALVNYTGATPTRFTGCSGGSGTVKANFLVSEFSPGAPISLGPTILSTGTIGSAYEGYNAHGSSYYITATGGSGSGYKFQVTGGALPAGISLAPATGLLSGKPTQSGTFAFTVTATDNATDTAIQQYSITVLPNPAGPSPTRYSPQQILQAYGINNIILSGGIRGDGAGQTIAILAGGDNPYFVSSTNSSTTIAARSNGQSVTTAGTIYVASTAGFPSSGTVLVHTTLGAVVITYTGTTGGASPAFTGCTTSATGGTLATGNAVGFNASDLHQFDSYFGLPDPPSFIKLDQYGGTNYPATADTGETAQDIEWVHAIAPAANIVVFEGMTNNPSIAMNYPGVTVVSNSYAIADSSGDTATDSQFLAPAGQNFTLVSAAGDNNGVVPPPGPKYPSDSPYVLAAGMTELATDSQGNYLGEAGNAIADFGSSPYESQPAFQQGIANPKGRTTPDVSFLGEATDTANSGTASYSSGASKINGGNLNSPWTNANGTSLATPAWAALLAIANQGLALTNQPALNGPTGTLPDLYNLPASDFHQITNLDNGSVSQGSSTFNQSGLGTPIANRLIPGLVGGHDTITGQVTAGGLQSGWTVFLSATPNAMPTPEEASTITDANGYYSFLVAPGTYYVNVVPPTGWNLPGQSSGPISFAAGADSARVANFLFTGPANQIYVDNLYQLLLHRNPDPGAAGWVNLLNAGASSASVVQDIENSPEYLNDVVTALYQHYLRRAPDPSAQGWVAALENGATIEQVTTGIVGSPEFLQNEGSGTNAGYVTALYQYLLQRAPDSGGYSAWLDTLANGASRASVAMAFLTSTEYRTDLVESDYFNYLRRSADPAGLASWVAALEAGITDQAVLAGILGSAEGYRKWS